MYPEYSHGGSYSFCCYFFYINFVRKGSGKYSEIYSFVHLIYTCLLDNDLSVNPYHAGYFKVLHSSPIFIQLACSIPVISMYLQAGLKTVWILISWLLRNQLIWIYTVFKIDCIRVQQEKAKL